VGILNPLYGRDIIGHFKEEMQQTQRLEKSP
jgi:hypothetical protein